MGTDWTSEQKSIYEDIKSEGFEVTVKSPGAVSEYVENSRYGIESESSEIDTYALKEMYKSREIDGSAVRQGDSKLVIPAYGLSIGPTDVIIIDDVEIKIVNIETVEPGNVPLIHEVQIRG